MIEFRLFLNKLRKNHKITFTTATIVTTVALVSIPVYAWFSNQRKAAVMTKIDAPTTLYIYAGGQQEDAANIDLGDIYIKDADLQAGINMYKEYVFCVSGKDVSYYDLQLAHTTNIPFEYEIYHAVDVTDSGTPDQKNDAVEYKSSKITNKTYYYSYGDAAYVGSINKNSVILNGEYLNQDELTDIAEANSSSNGKEINGKSYSVDSNEGAAVDNVQKNAYPLYWQTSESVSVYRNASTQTQNDAIKANGFNDYYILRISWDNQINTRDKETDIVYITARVGSASTS